MVKTLRETVQPHYCKVIEEVDDPDGVASKLYQMKKITPRDLDKVRQTTKFGVQCGAQTLLDQLYGKVCVEDFIIALRSKGYFELANLIAGIPSDGVSLQGTGPVGGNQSGESSPDVSRSMPHGGQISPGIEKPDKVTHITYINTFNLNNCTNIAAGNGNQMIIGNDDRDTQPTRNTTSTSSNTTNINNCTNIVAGSDNQMNIGNDNHGCVDEQSEEYEIVPVPDRQGERREVQGNPAVALGDSSCQSNGQSDVRQVSSTITEPQFAPAATSLNTDLGHLGIQLRSMNVTVDEYTEETEVKEVVARHCNEPDGGIRSVVEVAQRQLPQLSEITLSAGNEPCASKNFLTTTSSANESNSSHDSHPEATRLTAVIPSDERPGRDADNQNRLKCLLDVLCTLLHLYMTGTK